MILRNGWTPLTMNMGFCDVAVGAPFERELISLEHGRLVRVGVKTPTVDMSGLRSLVRSSARLYGQSSFRFLVVTDRAADTHENENPEYPANHSPENDTQKKIGYRAETARELECGRISNANNGG